MVATKLGCLYLQRYSLQFCPDILVEMNSSISMISYFMLSGCLFLPQGSNVS